MSQTSNETGAAMTTFQAYVAKAKDIEAETLVDVIEYWEAAVATAIKASVKPGEAGFRAGLAHAIEANLAVFRNRKWNPDAILSEMFPMECQTIDDWVKVLPAAAGDKTVTEMREWWRAAEKRILAEATQAKAAAIQTEHDRVTHAVKALIGESFAACIIALPSTKTTWDDLVQPPVA